MMVSLHFSADGRLVFGDPEPNEIGSLPNSWRFRGAQRPSSRHSVKAATGEKAEYRALVFSEVFSHVSRGVFFVIDFLDVNNRRPGKCVPPVGQPVLRNV
ncbi:hypothetical protein ES705_41903 [subsurface metagenome]